MSQTVELCGVCGGPRHGADAYCSKCGSHIEASQPIPTENFDLQLLAERFKALKWDVEDFEDCLYIDSPSTYKWFVKPVKQVQGIFFRSTWTLDDAFPRSQVLEAVNGINYNSWFGTAVQDFSTAEDSEDGEAKNGFDYHFLIPFPAAISALEIDTHLRSAEREFRSLMNRFHIFEFFKSS